MTPAPELTYKIATTEDAKKIVTLINAAFRIAEGFFLDRDRIDLTEILDLFQKGSFLVTEDGDSLTGVVYLEPRGDRMYLGLLSTEPAKQGLGLGSRLLSSAEAHARATGARSIDILIINLREGLPGFYKKRGYAETGTSPFPEDVETKLPCFFITMSKEL